MIDVLDFVNLRSSYEAANVLFSPNYGEIVEFDHTFPHIF